MDLRIEDLSFHIFPTASPPPELLTLHNKTYQLWLSVWEQTFQKLNLPADNLTDEFIRQDYIGCISHQGTPVAVHLYSFYAIDSLAARSFHYFKDNYPEIYFEKLARNNVRTVMSLEYMAVHPEWRKNAGKLHLGIILAGLSMRNMQSFGADAAIAPARRDHKVHELAYAYGGEPVIANVINHNVACDLIMVHRDRVKAHDSPEVQSCLESLWEGRTYCPILDQAPNNVHKLSDRKKAA